MADKDLERTLMELRDFEKNAKRLYESNAKAFDHVVWNWEEFVQGYRRTQTQDVKLEEKAPFFMGSLLTEQDCFPMKTARFPSCCMIGMCRPSITA